MVWWFTFSTTYNDPLTGLGIARANFDGTEVERVLVHDGDIFGLDFGPFVPTSPPPPSPAIPEPSTLTLFSIAILGILIYCYRRRKKAAS
ncbi:PEP-CTERM sorting domain-containing protein [Candidatus Poribacteria bacterium]|nr:PEP-CTERM sorting domain-containing protein [Candidatus Poribacteria bacterium]